MKYFIFIFYLPFFVFSQQILPEEVIFIPKKNLLGSLDLETTIFKPSGSGPFPLVIINHGKAPGNPHFQSRYRPLTAVRYFLERNYIVFVPMRVGFSKSGGSNSEGCPSMYSEGIMQSESLQPVIDYAHQLDYVDKSKTLIVGQSHGGLTTLAYGAVSQDTSIKGLVNFAGGLRKDQCPGWQNDLIRASGAFGKLTKIPTIWFYGDNDSFFSRELSTAMFEKYKEGNVDSQLINFGIFKNDSHTLFSDREGREIWEPHLTKFLNKIHLNTELVNPQYSLTLMPRPVKTNFALINEVEKVPNLNNPGKEAYKIYLEKSNPKAFAISSDGFYGWQSGGEDPLRKSIDNCHKKTKLSCELYAVDDEVVWNK